jgi:hypothetical protein
MAFPRVRRSDAFPVTPPEGVSRDGLSRHGMRAPRPRSDARFAQVGDRAAAITGLNRTLASPHSGYSCPPNALRISRAAE